MISTTLVFGFLFLHLHSKTNKPISPEIPTTKLDAAMESPPSMIDETYRKDLFLSRLFQLGLAEKQIARHKNLPRASILVLLFRFQDKWQVLLTQRPLTLKSHSGEVCCPGGKQDEQDGGDDVVTALRETHEEVGIDQEEIMVIARTQTIESVGGLCVTPIVAIWKNPVLPSALAINKDEVAAVFYVPISYFWNEENCKEKRDLEWRGGTFTMRAYHYKDTLEGKTPRSFKVWGLTAAVVYEVADLCRPTPCLELEGALYRWMDESRGKPYWAQRYYVLSSGSSSEGPRVLHQYDTERKAKAKADTANKKNRLQIDPTDCQITALEEEGGKFVFTVAVLDGRVQWKFAATTKEDRTKWLSVLNDATISEANEHGEAPNKKLKSEKSHL